jgi:hypothetical protein
LVFHTSLVTIAEVAFLAEVAIAGEGGVGLSNRQILPGVIG